MSTERRGVDRVGLAALAGAGTLVAHEVGYLADGAETVSHAYFGALGPIVLFAACAAAWVSALRVLRNDAGRLPSLAGLTGLQALIFTALEVGERITSDSVASLLSAPVVAGLLCQPLVAWGALRLLGLGRSVLERWRRPRARLAAARLLDIVAPTDVVVSIPALARLRVRGPPGLIDHPSIQTHHETTFKETHVNTTRNARRLGALTFTAALAVAACGSSDTADDDVASDDTPSTEASDDAAMSDDDAMDAMEDGAMEEMPAMAMNMGSPDVTPGEEVPDAALARGEFMLLDTRPSGYDDVAGTAVIARSDAGTTVTTDVTGLLPDTDYVSHVHESLCSDSGGDHFQFVDGTVEVPPNEIHLAFTSDANGAATWSAENDAVATDDGVAFVVHPVEFIDNKIACVGFVPDDADAVAAAIDSGPEFEPSTIEGMEGMNMNNMDMSAMEDMDEMEE